MNEQEKGEKADDEGEEKKEEEDRVRKISCPIYLHH
jgi:hypothetical protein